MAGTGKFSHVVKATSHMRSSTDGAADDGVGEQSPEAPKPPLPEGATNRNGLAPEGHEPESGVTPASNRSRPFCRATSMLE